jgi:hypothetical protein
MTLYIVPLKEVCFEVTFKVFKGECEPCAYTILMENCLQLKFSCYFKVRNLT